LNSDFHSFARNQELDICPTNLRAKIIETTEWISSQISRAVYNVGQAETQEDYNTRVEALFANLDKAEEVLSKERYICGEQFTIADIIFFTTLIRFDEAYYFLYKCNKKRIVDYPHLFSYLKELYEIETIRNTVRMDHIRASFYSNYPTVNQSRIIPIGPNSLEILINTTSYPRNSLKGISVPLPSTRSVSIPFDRKEQEDQKESQQQLPERQEQIEISTSVTETGA